MYSYKDTLNIEFKERSRRHGKRRY